MSDKMMISQLYQRIPPALQQRPHAMKPGTAGEDRPSFEQLLQAKLLKFSHHAESRLAQRGIQLNEEKLHKLENAVQQAADKGAKESLILMADAAFIVNVKNRTVVTAIDGSSLHEHVFTQIDSAIIVNS